VEDGISGWLQHCCKICCEKGGHCKRQACIIGRCNFQMDGLAYDTKELYIIIIIFKYRKYLSNNRLLHILWVCWVLLCVMGHLDTNNFYFILFYFSDFTLLFFLFFSFLLKDNEEGM